MVKKGRVGTTVLEEFAIWVAHDGHHHDQAQCVVGDTIVLSVEEMSAP